MTRKTKLLTCRPASRLGRAAGYSLIEMMMTLGIFGVVSAMAVVQIGQSRPGAIGDGAMRVAMSQMTSAREQAITQRRCMRLNFDLVNNQVQIIREEVPGPGLTVLSSVPFEGGVKFVIPGVRACRTRPTISSATAGPSISAPRRKSSSLLTGRSSTRMAAC